MGIKSVNCTALAVHCKSYPSARVRGIYWPSVKIQRRLDEEYTGRAEAQGCLEADSLLALNAISSVTSSSFWACFLISGNNKTVF